MQRWRRAGVILALGLLGAGCARWPLNLSQATWPVPPAIAPLALDRQVSDAIVCFFFPAEPGRDGGATSPASVPARRAAPGVPGPNGTSGVRTICLRASGLQVISLSEEATIRPGALLTPLAWQAIQGHADALRRAYCEGRGTLQRTNEEQVEALPICAPEPAE